MDGAVTGGDGGRGGDGDGSAGVVSGVNVIGSYAGSGGAGGSGIVATGAGATIIVNAAISGGDGGTAGIGQNRPVKSVGGAGGMGISGAGIAVVIGSTGSVSGGLGGDGTTRAAAIAFTGGTNSLTLESGYGVTGPVVGAGGTTNTLVLGGAIDGGFDVSTIGDLASAAQFQNFAAVDKTDEGTWTLTGTGTYTGPTTVSAGTLVVGDDLHPGTSLAGTVTVRHGGMLGGIGSVGGLVVESGGVAAPGNSIGTLWVAGDVTFETGSTYRVEAAPGSSDADLVHATGTATLTGGTVATAIDRTYVPLRTYRILEADGGVSGRFDGITWGTDFAFVTPRLDYSDTTVTMTLARNDVAFADVAATRNQTAVATALDGLTPGSNALWNAVAMLEAGAAPRAFDALSGEIHASLAGQLLEDSRFVRDAALGRLRDAAAGDGTVAWGRGFGAWQRQDTDGNAAPATRDIAGFIGGLDVPAFGETRLGILGAYSRSDLRSGDRASSAASDDLTLGLYGSTAWGAVTLRLGTAYTWHDVATRRAIAFDGFADDPAANYGAGTAQAFGELGYRRTEGGTAIEPFAGIAYVNQSVDGFREEGGAAALTAARFDQSVAFSTLGVHLSSSFEVAGLTVAAKATAGWRHAFGNTGPTARFAFDGSDEFAIVGLPIARDAAIADAGLDLTLAPNATLGLSYAGQFGGAADDHGARLTLAIGF